MSRIQIQIGSRMDTPGLLLESIVPCAEWAAVASLQQQKDDKSAFVWDLPIGKIRKLGYTPPPLPHDISRPDVDLTISERSIRARDGHPIALRVYEPLNPTGNSVLFFNIHGGGWVLGIPQTEEAQNRLVAVKNRAVVVSVDYRKAPEYPYPCPLEDCHDALLWCIENAKDLKIDAQKIIMGGGSAGANLTACLALICRRENIIGIIGQVLNIPVTCHPKHFPRSKYSFNSYEQNMHAPIVSGERMHWFWEKYVLGTEAEIGASPLLASSVEELPPTLIQVAGMDPLRDEGVAFAARLQEAGVRLTFKLYPGVPHAFYVWPELPQSREYLETVVQWIASIQETSL